MKDFKKLLQCYSLIDMNRNHVFCHSIDKEKYKISCENFFHDENVKSSYIQIAQESAVSSNESENIFLHWLNWE